MGDGTPERADIVIAGGGFAGLALAIALRQGLGADFTVVVADPALDGPAGEDARASAIAAGARRLFETIGVWDAVAADAQPIVDMVVTDSRANDAVKPVFLTFAGEVAPGEPFAHMVENRPLVDALAAAARAAGVVLIPRAVAGYEVVGERVSVRVGAATISAALLIAADGARSRLRELAGIATYGWSYGQSAIVTTVAHERDHGGRAEEHFLPAGPFAILPLKGRRSSIVWTEPEDEAARIVALPDELFRAELERRFGLHLGDIAPVGPRRACRPGYPCRPPSKRLSAGASSS